MKSPIRLFLFVIIWISLLSGQEFWEWTNIVWGGHVSSLAVDYQGNIFAGTTVGIFRSMNGGRSWSPLGSFVREVTVLVITSDGNILAGILGEGLFRSKDGGNSWDPMELNRTVISSLAVIPDKVIFAATGEDGVFRSTDDGETWKSVGFTGTGVRAIAIHGTGDILVGTWGEGVFRSQDNGETWEEINVGLTKPYVHCFAINADGDIFAGTWFGGVFRSNNNGDSWNQVITGLGTENVYRLAITPDGDIFAGLWWGGIYRSTDNGEHWFNVTSCVAFPFIRSLTVNAHGHVFSGTNGGGVYVSTDKGDTWTAKNGGLTSPTWVNTIAIGPYDNLYVGTSQGTIFRSKDAGGSWAQINPCLDLDLYPVNDIATNSAAVVFAVTGKHGTDYFGGNGVFRSRDEGESWTRIARELSDIIPISLGIDSQGVVFLGTFGNGVYRSMDNGDTWSDTNVGLGLPFVTDFAFNSKGNVLVATGYYYYHDLQEVIHGEGVFRSTDNGESWTHTGLDSIHVSCLTVDRSDRIFAGTLKNGLFRSTDDGISWQQLVSPDVSVTSIVINSTGNLFAATSQGVFYSGDAGETWTQIESDVVFSSVSSLATNSRDVLFGGSFNGILRSVRSTGVADTPVAGVPNSFQFYPLFPNPFNPTTTIQYDLPRADHVSLIIYDLLGREVEAAVDRWQEAGTHSVVWDATNMPTGIYLVRMVSGDFSQVRKVMVLK